MSNYVVMEGPALRRNKLSHMHLCLKEMPGTHSLNCIQNVYIGTKHTYPFSASSDTVLRSFQYKILHRILPTDKYLFTCKLKKTQIYVIFWECPITQHLWSQLVNFLNNRGILISLNIMDVCIGTDQCRNHNSTINYALLLLKFYIYTTKLCEMIPVFCVFRNYLHKRINLEKQIALTKNKLEIFYNMWSFIF